LHAEASDNPKIKSKCGLSRCHPIQTRNEKAPATRAAYRADFALLGPSDFGRAGDAEKREKLARYFGRAAHSQTMCVLEVASTGARIVGRARVRDDRDPGGE
jgi:hypothetical protein